MVYTVFVKALNASIVVTEDGKFTLPPYEYDLTTLNAIAKELRKAMRESRKLEIAYEKGD